MISWSSGPNRLQVKHFREEDCPSKVGRGSQHHLQLQGMPSYKSLAMWKCPPKFNLNENWLVVAGEESKEALDQVHREQRVHEVVYPCRSAIPPNPYTSSDLDRSCDDNQTPVIRIIPIEEEADVKASSHVTPTQASSSKSPVSGMPPAKHNPVTQNIAGFEGDVTVAIATAVAALAKSQEQGSLIDANLLVRLLQNPEEIPKLMNERGLTTDAKTGAATAGSLIAAMSRPVDLLVPLPRTKPDKVSIKPINEYQVPHAGSGPIFGPKPMAKSVPLTMTRPETSVKSNLVNEQGARPHVETANIRASKSLAHPTSDLNLEKIKKLINKYGVPDNVGGKPLVNTEYNAVLSSTDHPTILQPKSSSLSPNVCHTSPFSSLTSHAPLHKDINYCKSLIKQYGENYDSVVDERLQNTNPRGNTRAPGLLTNQRPIQRSLTPCVFFNKPMGCRNGSSCPFLHDISGLKRSGGMLEAVDLKRMK